MALTLASLAVTSWAQQPVHETEQAWEDHIQLITETDDEDDAPWQDAVDELASERLDTLALNRATREELLRLGILTEQQADQFLLYRYQHGALLTWNELVLVPYMDWDTRQRLRQCCTLGEAENPMPERPDFWGRMRHEAVLRTTLPLYHRQGQLSQDGTGYMGSRLPARARYRFASRHIDACMQMDRDAGERGIDHWGGAVMLHDMGRVLTAVVGDYLLGYGMGLVMSNAYSFGKGNWDTNTRQGIRMKTGAEEANYMHGAALQLQPARHWALSLFYSQRRWDATLDTDGTARTIIRDGYHRTTTEIAKKHNLPTQVVGGDLTWSARGWWMGTTGYYLHTGRALSPGDEAYRRFYPQGSDFGVMGIHYGYQAYRWSIRGETAYNTGHGGWASLLRISAHVGKETTLWLLPRYYQARYSSFFANALAEGSNAQNQQGIMLGLQSLVGGITLRGYADVYRHPWQRYHIPHPSSGQEAMLQMEGTPHRHQAWQIRYRIRHAEESTGKHLHQRLRLQWTMQMRKRWALLSQAQWHGMGHEHGFLLTQRVQYGIAQGSPLRVSGQFSYFHTDSYATRLQSYEPSVLLSMSGTPLYGHGVRGVVTVRYTVRILTLEAKYGATRMLDRPTIGTGLQTIYAPGKQDITLQARIRY